MIFLPVQEVCVLPCSDGVRQSGVYAAVTSILERAKDEQEVDIFQAVKHVQYHRPEAFQELVSYERYINIHYPYCF